MRRPLAWLVEPDPRSQRAATWVVRGLGLVYAVAFVSLAVQVRGLIGPEGILPVEAWLDGVRGSGSQARGWLERTWLVPTIFWWLSPTNLGLSVVCWGGALCGALVALGWWPRRLLVVAYLAYLSLAHADSLFLGYQWDALLLESGFAGIFVAPPGRWLGRATLGPPRLALFWVRAVLFKLYFLSFVVKVLASTPDWVDLTALVHHYETQPLPTPLSWFAHHLPRLAHEAGTLGTLVIEGGAPLLFLVGRRARLIAFGPVVGLQVLIAATGNYGFFNLLTVVLALSLLDDRALRALTPARWRREPSTDVAPGRSGARRRRAPLVFFASVALVLSSLHLAAAFVRRDGPEWLGDVLFWSSPPRIANSYGLFANMTRERPEIVVEGSNDGAQWEAFAFEYKVGPLGRVPAFAPLHLPRLDWQMWFAALAGDCRARRARWFQLFARRLLEGGAEVRALLAESPFAEAPPRYVRATLWNYRFTTPEERARTGLWWAREREGPFCPVLTLGPEGQLMVPLGQGEGQEVVQ